MLLADNRVGFKLSNYDHTQPLIIDPVLSYSTYLGGSGYDYGLGIAVDSSCNAYVTGEAYSADFPTQNRLQAWNGPTDIFMTKLNSLGSAVVYSTFLGGNNYEGADDIAVDSQGNTFLTGWTDSTDFPTVNAFQSAFGAGIGHDAFLTKLNATGSAVVYSTYLGGSGEDFGVGTAVDASGSAYVAGWTQSSNFPTSAGGYQTTFGGNQDGFVAKLNTNVSGTASLVYSTYLGGANYDNGYGIAVDASGKVYVTGQSNSLNFPTTPSAFQSTCTGCTGLIYDYADAFVAKLDPSQSGSAGLVYSTFLGGSGPEYGYGIAVDANGKAYVTGETGSSDFPTAPGAFQTFPGGECLRLEAGRGGFRSCVAGVLHLPGRQCQRGRLQHRRRHFGQRLRDRWDLLDRLPIGESHPGHAHQ